ncbi:MAG: AmmeMemoRadiSam system protein A [Elusimicrobiota bacterium]
MGLKKEQKKKLLNIARNTIKTYVKKGKKQEFEVRDEVLNEKRGVFVTLRKNGNLRGCIGTIFPQDKLYKSVRDMAIQASTRDYRFSSVQPGEVDSIEIEISVLTVPKKVGSHDDIKLGRDGVIVKKGIRQGVYLPQVADETGWDKEKFLNSLCQNKAGLPKNAWKNNDTELLTFQAEVFSEN